MCLVLVKKKKTPMGKRSEFSSQDPSPWSLLRMMGSGHAVPAPMSGFDIHGAVLFGVNQWLARNSYVVDQLVSLLWSHSL